ncbi:MAG TPA: hypothetical protein VFM18_13110 [Methanosarcina sp.]|nr:hypothetical protein [Methanosarcina sp.]
MAEMQQSMNRIINNSLTSLEQAAVTMERVIEELALDPAKVDEDIEILSGPLRVAVERGRDVLSLEVDRFVKYLNYLDLAIQHAEKVQDQWRSRVKALKRLQIYMEESALLTVKSFPEIQFSGEVSALRAQKNSKASLKLGFETKSHNVSNVVDATDIAFHGIEERFYRPITVYQLDTEAVREALADGETLDWAKLECGYHLRKGLPGPKELVSEPKKRKPRSSKKEEDPT